MVISFGPVSFPRDNIFTDMVRFLYSIDTPTNVLPSIHVYNSIAAFIAIARCKALKNNRLVVGGTFILTVSIVAATMFLKQHTIVDVVLALRLECGRVSAGLSSGRQPCGCWTERIFEC